MIRVWFDFPTEGDRPSVSRWVSVVPRIGEHVGVVPLDDRGHYRLDKVVDVRHFVGDDESSVQSVGPEIRVLLGGGGDRSSA